MSLSTRLVLLGLLALVTVASHPAAAWHVRIEGCLQPCSAPTVVTTPDLPWLLPFHPPNPCVPAANFVACVVP